jgi:hypothetical protein
MFLKISLLVRLMKWMKDYELEHRGDSLEESAGVGGLNILDSSID